MLASVVSGDKETSKFASMLAVNSRNSIRARLIPKHALGPLENGICISLAAGELTSSVNHLSGVQLLGMDQTLGSL